MSNKDLFNEEVKSEYTQFVEKFEVKLTTDDCYTPPAIYDWILGYVKEQCSIGDDVRILRPFKPSGDYKAEDYSGDCVVIDNPPFSILSEIRRFYIANGIKYFLFAPHLIVLSGKIDDTKIVAGASITYENGAKINTSFISNMFGDYEIIVDPKYKTEIKKIQDTSKVKLPKYIYPNNVISIARLNLLVQRDGEFRLKKSDVKKVSHLSSQKRMKKVIFGSGYLIGNKRAEELRAEELRAEELKIDDNVIIWDLSPQEKNIIAELDGNPLPFVEQKLF